MVRPDALLLDVMGTLVHDPFYEELPAHFGLDLDALLAQKHPTAWIDFELGHIDEATYLARFFRDGRPVDGAALRACLVAAWRWLPGIPELLDGLAAAGTAVHLLSNYPPWFSVLDDHLALSRRVDRCFLSWQRGVRKPDPAAFLGPLQELGLSPGQVLFVDDQRRNVDAAAALGLRVHHFVDVAGLQAALEDQGVLSPR